MLCKELKMRLSNGTTAEYSQDGVIEVSRIIDSKLYKLSNTVKTVKGVFLLMKAYEYMSDSEFKAEYLSQKE